MGFIDFHHRHQQQPDETPRRPNWVKKPSLLSDDLQPAVIDVLEELLRRPLEYEWHGSRLAPRDRLDFVATLLPAEHHPWAAGSADEFASLLPRVFKPALARRLARPAARLAERAPAAVRRCEGAALHPGVVYRRITLSALARVCERCQAEYPAGTSSWEPPAPAPAPAGDDDDYGGYASRATRLRKALHLRPPLGPLELAPARRVGQNAAGAAAPSPAEKSRDVAPVGRAARVAAWYRARAAGRARIPGQRKEKKEEKEGEEEGTDSDDWVHIARRATTVDTSSLYEDGL